MGEIIGEALEMDLGSAKVVFVPTDEAPVSSVNGKTGDVKLKTSDIPDDSGYIRRSDMTRSPELTPSQKAAIKRLMDDYTAIRERFIYNDDSNSRNTLASNAVLNTAAHEPGKQVYRLNCSNFVQLIMMGRSAADFPADGNYSPAITKAFGFGYYARFPFRQSAGGLHKTNAQTGDMEYYGFKAPHGAGDDRESYSDNTYYTGSSNPHGQSFRGYMTSAELAFELHKLGCEIPLSDVQQGDILFFKAQGDGTDEDDNFRKNKIAWRNIVHCAMVYSVSDWPKAGTGDPVTEQAVAEKFPNIIECTTDSLTIVKCGVNYEMKSDRTHYARLMFNAVMAARLPIAWGIHSNVPDEITYLKSADELLQEVVSNG